MYHWTWTGPFLRVDMNDHGINDKISSWYCGKNLAYDFCNDNNNSCGGGQGLSGAGTAYSRQIGFNNRLTILNLYPYDVSKRGAVMVFSDQGCQEDVSRFYSDDSGHERKDYTNSEMYNNHLRNDKASSVMVPYGYSVDLYDNYGFSGVPLTLKGKPWKGPTTQSMECINLGDYGWNDKVSSLTVIRKIQGKAQGKWVELVS